MSRFWRVASFASLCALTSAWLRADDGAMTTLAMGQGTSGFQAPRDVRKPDAGPARVHGRVVSADTGTPIRDVTVTLEDASGFAWVVTTDDQGIFDFRDLPLAALALRIKKNGFVNVSSAVPSQALKDRLTMDVGVMRLIRAGVIAGRVLDRYGDPVVDLPVMASRLSYPNPGERRLEPVMQVGTNDLGEYRLFGLAGGTYFVSVGLGRGFAATYFGGTTVPADAQPVVVQPGDQAGGTDISLKPETLGQLSGTVVDAGGRPGSDSFVILSAARLEGARGFTVVRVETDDEGRFRFADLVPGDYQLDVIAFASAGAILTAGSATPVPGRVAPEFASVTVPIIGQSGDVVIHTTRGSRLVGRVTIDGQRPSSAAVAGLKVTTVPVGLVGSKAELDVSRATEVSADGTFAIDGLTGTRSIGISGGGTRLELLQVTLNGTDLSDDAAAFDRGDIEGLEIVLISTPSVVSGHVIDAAGNRAAGDVIIFAEDRRLWTRPRSRHVAYAHSEVGGGFAVSSLPPGQYLAVAVDGVDRTQRANPDLLDLLRSKAVAFSLAAGETKTLTLTRR